LPTVVALLKIFADVHFCAKENSCISAAMARAKFIMITLEETDCKGVVELKETLQQNMNQYFYGEDVRQHFISFKKSQLHVVATLLDPRLEMGFFHEEKLIRQSYCWSSWTKAKKERISWGRITWRSR